MLPALGGCGRESYAAGFAQGASHSPLTLSLLIHKGLWAGGLRPLSSSFITGTAPVQGSRFEALHLNCVNYKRPKHTRLSHGVLGKINALILVNGFEDIY